MRVFIFMTDCPGKPIVSFKASAGHLGMLETLSMDDAEAMTLERWHSIMDEMRKALSYRAADIAPQEAAPAPPPPPPPSVDRAKVNAALDRYAPRPPAQGEVDGPLPVHTITDANDPDAWRSEIIEGDVPY